MPRAVRVVTRDPGVPGLPAAALAAVLAAAGLAADPSAPVALVLGLGDPGDGDELVRSAVPHLHVIGAAGHVQVGPFVAPGLTACLRCLAAADALPDPAAADPAAADPALLLAGLALAARDLAHWPDDVPVTWSRTLTLDGGLVVQPRRWHRHPHCGCAWDEAV
ncbi:hypothetical protein [Nocardioides gansuensis]|uniref:hypothetical protein n=1 Tax=Nocardioides gansuensis TaxID=2138300 RepID=UPI0014035F0A|nr:hypothetical protein [Nocardioides gansuensis]